MIKWKEAFSVNIKEIDEQHKRLFEIGGKLINISDMGDETFMNEKGVF